jgi:acyl-coenzyme A synthetase/AMP-(fatty) acid ligase
MPQVADCMQTVQAGPQLLRDWIERAAQRHPDKPCIVCAEDGSILSYNDLRELTVRIGAYLRASGLGRNDRVALLANNSIEHLACYFGVMACGATICTVHVEMNRHHLQRILPAINPRLILFEDGLDIDDVLDATSAPRLPLGRWDGSDAGGFYADLGRSAPGDSAVQTACEQDDAVIFFTSGTSDRPKGVVMTFRELLCNAVATANAFGMTGDDRIYDFRSFNWCSAQVLSALAPLACGATLILGRRFSRSRFFEHIKQYGATIAAGNPTTVNMLLNSNEKTRASDVPSLRFVTSSSAPLLIEEWQRFEDYFGIRVSQGYGCSEIGWIAANPGEQRRLGTVGKPHAYLNVRILDRDERALSAGEAGSVEAGGFEDSCFRYLAEDGTFKINSRGRMKTGDLGFIDADGFLHLTGREKELIIRGGVNISPVEIDSLLMQRPEVVEAATVGVPDRTYGEEVVSYVVLRPGSSIEPDEILRYCNAVLSAFKAPKQILFTSDLPKNERGKLDRKALLERWKMAQAGSPTPVIPGLGPRPRTRDP